jgi:spermidine synthase
LSGFCGISYEILYGRILGNILGEQFTVTASILLTFMLGIGAGMLLGHRLWRHLWLIEAAVGGCAALLASCTDALDRLVYFGTSLAGNDFASTLLICFILLCLPAFLIGCSLPLFAGYLNCISSERVFNRAYAIYNLGAAVTAFLIEFLFLRLFGLKGTTLLIASINALLAVGLLAGFRNLRAAKPAPAGRVSPGFRLLVALALASVASAVFQLVMVKVSECLFGPFRETFALVLTVIFLGIAAGATLTGRWRLRFDHLLAIALFGLAWLLGGFDLCTRLYSQLYSVVAGDYWFSVFLKLAILLVLMGLPSLAFGATIPAMLNVRENVARESGYLLFVSSTANAAGFLMMAFYLHGHFDYGTLVVIVAALTAGSLIVYIGIVPRRLGAVMVFLLAIVALHRTLWDEKLLYLGYDKFSSASLLEENRRQLETTERFKGRQDVFSINWFDGEPFFFINGYISFPLAEEHERLVGALSALFAPRLDNALVLGMGSGASAGSLCLLFDRVDAVEINPAVFENLHRLAEWNFNVESRRPLHKILNDAMAFAKRAEGKYSLILNTVTSPLYFSSSKLYTRDFFELIRKRLTPDGVYITWVDLRVGDEGIDTILKTLSGSFQECAVASVKSRYFLLICSEKKIKVRQLQAVANNREMYEYFFCKKGIPLELLPYSLVTTSAFDLIRNSSAPVNTLDYPALEFEMARLRSPDFDRFLERLSQKMNVAEVAGAFAPVTFDPMKLAIYNMMVLPEDAVVAQRWYYLVAGQTPDFDERIARITNEYRLCLGKCGWRSGSIPWPVLYRLIIRWAKPAS